MPQPTLAAIVIAAMLHLTKPRNMRDLFVRDRWAFMIAMIVFVADLACWGRFFLRVLVHLETALKSSLAKIRPPVEHVLLDFSPVNYIDVSACDELTSFIKELKNQGVTVARVYAIRFDNACR